MATQRTADEVRDEHISLMGPDLGPLYYELRREVSWLHQKWNRYLTLFAKEEPRIDLMNDTAPAFFSQLQHQLVDDVLLHISRLAGPGKSLGKDNLALARLPDLLPDAVLQSEVSEKLKTLSGLSEFAKDHRHRRLAHRDLALAMKAVDERPLETATRERVEHVLVEIRSVMNTVLVYFKESLVRYELTIGALGDVDSLLHYLKLGQQAEQESFDALRASVHLSGSGEEQRAQGLKGCCMRIEQFWRKLLIRVQAQRRTRV